ncbi:MAG: MATE family efflux transporter [Selenomonas sp.]|uniref:MATE family efflux transporter n=1 Tax=Selenomonas sp. TaxID=2053611 RepID=UPI0025E25ED0|nr:MATE family efflux transporter [Selenomonas sp.]MCR5756555.1 MATE family efflux transporter [Selenomonas sp.]
MRKNLLGRISKGEPFSLRELLLLTWQLSVPAIMAKITTVMMQYIDASMVGMIGAGAAASIGLVNSTAWLIGGVAFAMSMGYTIQLAQAIGAGEELKARSLVRHGLWAVVIFSFVLGGSCAALSGQMPYYLGGTTDIAEGASTYLYIYALGLPFLAVNFAAASMLQASGNMKIPSLLSVSMCILDVVFNALLIFPSRNVELWGWLIWIPGGNLGVAGVALGTVLAEVCCMVAMLYVLLKKSRQLHYRQEQLLSWQGELQEATRLGVPMALEQVVMGSAYVAFTCIVAPLGTVALAANSFAITAESLCYMPGIGVSTAAQTLVGQSVGAGRSKLAQRFGYVSAGLGMLVMLVMGIVMYICAPGMMALLSQDGAVIAAGTEILRIEAWAEPLFAAGIIVTSIFRGAGETKMPTILNLVAMWGIRIPLATYLAVDYGLPGVWAAMCTELCARGLLSLGVLIWRGEGLYRRA